MEELELQTSDDLVSRLAHEGDPVRAVVELVWNAIDAEAASVEVLLERSESDAVVGVKVVDDGHGISSDEVRGTFGRIGDSWKKLATRQSRYLLNRAENSHQPTRQRERAMKRFKSVGHAQRFLSAFSGISAHFRPRRHRLSATQWRTEIDERFAVWREGSTDVVVGHFRPGSAGQRPPRVSMAMPIRASGLW